MYPYILEICFAFPLQIVLPCLYCFIYYILLLYIIFYIYIILLLYIVYKTYEPLNTFTSTAIGKHRGDHCLGLENLQHVLTGSA